ncbi:MAG: lamin tail domain-containing protein, partial [Nanoarchaeota archaeon]|nr:lamin tail domain-containing protein [Nanoarchaeota archaeon]
MRNTKTVSAVFFIMVVLLFALLSGVLFVSSQIVTVTEKGVKAAGDVLIVEVYYDTYLSYEPEEYVAVFNQGIGAVNMSGWNITDLEGTITFPSNTNTTLYSNGCFFVTGNASAFKEETGQV